MKHIIDIKDKSNCKDVYIVGKTFDSKDRIVTNCLAKAIHIVDGSEKELYVYNTKHQILHKQPKELKYICLREGVQLSVSGLNVYRSVNTAFPDSCYSGLIVIANSAQTYDKIAIKSVEDFPRIFYCKVSDIKSYLIQ